MKFFLFLNKVNSNFKKADIVRYKEYSIKKTFYFPAMSQEKNKLMTHLSISDREIS